MGKSSWEKIQAAIVLEKDEKVLGGYGGALKTIHQKVRTKKGIIRDRHEVVEANVWKPGFLVLTTQRLVWVRQRGTFGKSYHVTMEIPLEDVTGISGSGKVLKNVIISDRTGENIFRLKADWKSVQASVTHALKERKKALEEIRRKERIHVMIDFSSLADYMKKGGLSLTTIKCPECNAPLKMPKNGTEIICQYCKNTIYAQDIFEKIKSLI